MNYITASPNLLPLVALILCACSIVLIVVLFKTKSRLKEQENRLRTIFESEPECVKLQSKDGTVLEMNTAGLRILEVDSASEVIGRTVFEFINSEHHESYRKLTERVFQGYSEMMEFKIHSQSGKERWLETNAVPLKDNQNNIQSLLAITRDISERKNLEAKLKQRQLDLERVCRVSTMGEVASGIAHELNQPLCAISSYSETCLSALNSNNIDGVKENLKLIFEQSQKASGIISWIRELAANRESDLSKINLASFLDEFKAFIEFYLEKHKVNLKLSLNKDVAYVYGNRVQLEHVLFNLITNSVESMQNTPFDRTISISISSYGKTSKVLIKVKDRGAGIAKGDTTRVVNPYFTTRENGLGMGLPISKSIVKAHGGELWIDDTSEYGTTIAFTLLKKPVSKNSIEPRQTYA